VSHIGFLGESLGLNLSRRGAIVGRSREFFLGDVGLLGGLQGADEALLLDSHWSP